MDFIAGSGDCEIPVPVALSRAVGQGGGKGVPGGALRSWADVWPKPVGQLGDSRLCSEKYDYWIVFFMLGSPSSLLHQHISIIALVSFFFYIKIKGSTLCQT